MWHVGLSLSSPEAAEHAKLSREITDLRKALQDKHRASRSKAPFLPWCQSVASRGGTSAYEAQRFIGLSNSRKRLLYRATARQELTLRILMGALADAESRAIVFHESIPEIEHMFLVAEREGMPAVLEHSKLPDRVRDDNIEAFRSGVARVIVSAKSLVEGFNVPSADVGIIAASNSSVRQRIQSLGRLLRRKEGRRHARVMVLYVRETSDEEIYRSADWEQVVGVGRNRYFHWVDAEGQADWTAGLVEQPGPPRSYRPPSADMSAEALVPGEPYSGRPDGSDLRVDAAQSLRTTDGRMVPASPDLVGQILERNPFRRAHRTAAGHLVVRVDGENAREEQWIYLGSVAAPAEESTTQVVKYTFKRSQGRRHIARADSGQIIKYALGVEHAKDPAAAEARERLLKWTAEVEAQEGLALKDLYWDGVSLYWLEIRGERVAYPSELAALEFHA